MDGRICVIFPFSIGNSLFGKIWSKKSTCQFKLKFGPKTNSNIHNSMVVFTVSALDRK